MQVEKKPYEMLVRWDADGKLHGAHVQWSNVVTNDDGTKQVYPLDAEPLSLDGNGFPIADVLKEAEAAALASCMDLRAALANVESERDESRNELADTAEKLVRVSNERDLLARKAAQ